MPGWLDQIRDMNAAASEINQRPETFHYEPPFVDNFIKFTDSRTINPVTKLPLNPNKDLKTGKYSQPMINAIGKMSNLNGVDPNLMLAIGLQETNLGKADDGRARYNVGHVLSAHNNGLSEEDNNKLSIEESAALDMINSYKDKVNYAKKLGYTNDTMQLQAYNGFGKLTPSTEKDYHGGLTKSFYGVDVTKTPLDMSKNPAYAKTVLSLKDAIKKDPNIQKSINDYLAPVNLQQYSTEKSDNTSVKKIPMMPNGGPIKNNWFNRTFRNNKLSDFPDSDTGYFDPNYGYVTPTIKVKSNITPPADVQIRNAQEFTQGWLDSPMYKQMLHNSLITSNQYSTPEKNPIYQDRQDNLNITGVRKVTKEFFPNQNTGGNSDPKKNIFKHLFTPHRTINIRTDMSPKEMNISDTTVHEYSHSTDDGGELIPISDTNKMYTYSDEMLTNNRDEYLDYEASWKEYFKQNPESYTKDEQQKILDNGISTWSWNSYLAAPTETRARLNTIRYQGKTQGIYDPYKEKINRHQLNKIKDNTDFSPLNQLRDIYKTKDIIEMLNSISQNTPQNNIPIARNGGLLKYPNGGTPPDSLYQSWRSKLPKNLQVESPDYNLRGAFEAGLQPQLQDDGTYHLNSRNPQIGEILKGENHPTFQHAMMEDRKMGYIPNKGADGKWYTQQAPPFNVDSVLNAHNNLDWVQRLYGDKVQSIPTPTNVQGYEPGQTSTHRMADDGKGYVFPEVVNINGKLKNLGNRAEDYAKETNTGIQLSPKDGSWFSVNGYKTGTGVLKGQPVVQPQVPQIFPNGFKPQFKNGGVVGGGWLDSILSLNRPVPQKPIEILPPSGYRENIAPIDNTSIVNPVDITKAPQKIPTTVTSELRSSDKKFDKDYFGNPSIGAMVSNGLANMNQIPAGRTINDILELGTLGELGLGVSKNLINNIYRINPFAFKATEGMLYRGIGKEGMEDALNSGVLRAKQNIEPFMVNNIDLAKRFKGVYYSPDFKIADTYGNGFIAEVPESASNFGNRYARGKDWSKVTKEQIPIERGKILKKDWLQGYKEIKVPKVKSPTKQFKQGGKLTNNWLDKL